MSFEKIFDLTAGVYFNFYNTPEYIIILLIEYIHVDEVVGVSSVRSLDPDITP